ncbi:WecB/TagA/CpsF family glycosyltransferase [Demequina lignilytica]|uniref:WecB/TagA/CpsF family glycosyltransferase n=1 Tax=Demequina lignilytica TaxID=3051663 RepID=A0AB35MK60_9MICO|nr:WecB/TagA/CpsF family glycosyltransferase [Demequina sp. SYSU T0a273]MDN4484182.1 WecB/TagA/CpsF family glycosyltransferase [Demequina sp. SYSU T0a273]
MTQVETGQVPFETRLVGHVPFGVASPPEIAHWLISSAIPRRLAVNVRLANAFNVALADQQGEYRHLLATGGVNFADGAPVAWVLNRGSAEPRAHVVRGPSLFESVLKAGVPSGVRHFFLGATEPTLDALNAEVRSRIPGVVIAGSFSPPFADPDAEFIELCRARVAVAQPDVVWVGLGTPKQDLVGTELASALGAVTINVGAAFDFLAGTVREAPAWIHGTGLEWMFRLVTEPRRLWRRYLFGNAAFVAAAAAGVRRQRKEAASV